MKPQEVGGCLCGREVVWGCSSGVENKKVAGALLAIHRLDCLWLSL